MPYALAAIAPVIALRLSMNPGCGSSWAAPMIVGLTIAMGKGLPSLMPRM